MKVPNATLHLFRDGDKWSIAVESYDHELLRQLIVAAKANNGVFNCVGVAADAFYLYRAVVFSNVPKEDFDIAQLNIGEFRELP
jgi:hypothetical protein